MVSSSDPFGSSSTNVSRRLNAFPSTLYTCSPCSFSIQKSSPIENSFRCSLYRAQLSDIGTELYLIGRQLPTRSPEPLRCP